jgi:hypothetical protein
MSSPQSLISNSISISDSLDDSCTPTLLFFQDLLLFLLLVSLVATRLSSPDTPATASCKEKLLIALHNSFLIVLLDLWQQNILRLDEKWVGRLLAL